jgi:hypothetical protein
MGVVISLVTFISGCSVLLVGAGLPDPQPSSITLLIPVNQGASAPLVGPEDAAVPARDSHLRAGRSRLHSPADCLGAALTSGRRAESVHLATVAHQRPGECGDVRGALVEMAAAHYQGRGLSPDYCGLMGMGCPSQGQANGGDRIANALFSSACLWLSASTSADAQESVPQVPHGAWDARWDLFMMAGAQRDGWIQQCRYPAYPIEDPRQGPR